MFPRRINYHEYMHSLTWEYKKALYKASPLWTGACHACGSYEPLHFHHRTYERLGREALDDLVPLCPECHKWVHAIVAKGEPLFYAHETIRTLRQQEQWSERRCRRQAAAEEARKHQPTKSPRRVEQERYVATVWASVLLVRDNNRADYLAERARATPTSLEPVK